MHPKRYLVIGSNTLALNFPFTISLKTSLPLSSIPCSPKALDLSWTLRMTRKQASRNDVHDA
jgi:hypothetical protein